jgi:hypothetical protein
MLIQKWVRAISVSAPLAILAGPAFADCSALPTWQALKTALAGAVSSGGNGGLGFNMWGTLVADDGTVCAVAFSGGKFVDQWLGSRVISAQKANTANAFSVGKGSTPATSLFGTGGLALSTANLFTAVQPGGSLYGLQHSNPVDTGVAYGNSNGQPGLSQASFQPGQSGAQNFGTARDPMVGDRIGGVNVFGGGLALYRGGIRVGGLGVSGDTSCTDHMVAWKVRAALALDGFNGVAGVAAALAGDTTHPDNIIYDIGPNPDGTGGTGQAPSGTGGVGQSPTGFGHPKCLNTADPKSLPPVH